MERDWREAKPKWAVDAAEAEIAGMKRRLALRWPDQARPEEVGFRWGDYDHLTGEVVPGSYFFHSHKGEVCAIDIRERAEGDPGMRFAKWRFRCPAMWGDKWIDSVIRGPLYRSEEEAQLAALWAACDHAAEELERLWAPVLRDRGFI